METNLNEKGMEAAYLEYFKKGFDPLYPATSIETIIKAYFEGVKND